MNRDPLMIFKASLIWAVIMAIFFCIIGIKYAKADEWKPRHVNKEILWQGLNVIDTIQSIQFADNPGEYHERGLPRLFWGQHPSRLEMFGTMVAWGIAHWRISDALPERWHVLGMELRPKDFFQDFTIGITGTTICFNYSLLM